jgi:hypothetical protein
MPQSPKTFFGQPILLKRLGQILLRCQVVLIAERECAPVYAHGLSAFELLVEGDCLVGVDVLRG